MDHYIKHDADIRSTKWIGGESMRFEKPRVCELSYRSMNGRVEALHVADLEYSTVALSCTE